METRWSRAEQKRSASSRVIARMRRIKPDTPHGRAQGALHQSDKTRGSIMNSRRIRSSQLRKTREGISRRIADRRRSQISRSPRPESSTRRASGFSARRRFDPSHLPSTRPSPPHHSGTRYFPSLLRGSAEAYAFGRGRRASAPLDQGFRPKSAMQREVPNWPFLLLFRP